MHYCLATAQRHITWRSRDKPWASNNEANRLRRMTMQVTSTGLARARLQVCALRRESWLYIFSVLHLNMSFTQWTVLCTEVTFHDDLVAYAHKSRKRTSRSHAQPWQRGISHLLGVKTTQCKQNGHVPHVNTQHLTNEVEEKEWYTMSCTWHCVPLFFYQLLPIGLVYKLPLFSFSLLYGWRSPRWAKHCMEVTIGSDESFVGVLHCPKSSYYHHHHTTSYYHTTSSYYHPKMVSFLQFGHRWLQI